MLEFLKSLDSSNRKAREEEERTKKEEKKKLRKKLMKKYLIVRIILIITTLYTSYKIGDLISDKKIFIGIITLLVFLANNELNENFIIEYQKILPSFILSGYLIFLIHFKPEQKMKILKIILGILGFVAINGYKYNLYMKAEYY